MSERVRWSYVQARLQARHGDRLDDAAWRMLEAARSFDQFLERSRTTSLHRFTDPIEVKMPSHTIERILRAAWRDYVAELATWVTPSWQPAVLWVAHLPDLPVLDSLFKGTSPAWTREDPVFAPFARGDLQDHAAESRSISVRPPLAGDRPARVAGRSMVRALADIMAAVIGSRSPGPGSSCQPWSRTILNRSRAQACRIRAVPIVTIWSAKQRACSVDAPERRPRCFHI